jgi:hypothetical protein
VKIQDQNRDLWLWLFNEGGRYTAAEIAKAHDISASLAMQRLYSMQRRDLIAKFPPAAGSRRQRYGITGLCEVPCGMTIAEVQA